MSEGRDRVPERLQRGEYGERNLDQITMNF